MTQSRNKLQRAWHLLLSGTLDWLNSEAIRGRLERGLARVKNDPAITRTKAFLGKVCTSRQSEEG